MNRLAIGIMGIGLLGAVAVYAHDDFDVHDTVLPEAQTQEVVLPNEEEVDAGLTEEYQKALERAQRRGDYSAVQDLIDREASAPEPSLTGSPVSNHDFPFSILDISLDADQDGLSDADEIRIATKPREPDSDGDGYIDGLEVVRGYNPLVASPGDKIKYKKPLTGSNEQYRITGIRLSATGAKEMLTITGTGPNNSLVAILGYSSEEFVWVTRTDKTGRFTYVSGDTLDPGVYTFYAASISANGVTLEASEPLMFERTLDALIKIESPTEPKRDEGIHKTNRLWWYAIVATGGGALLIGVLVVSWVVSRKKRIGASP